jgi:hypothetical protein
MRFLSLSFLFIPLLACSSIVPANEPLQLNATAGVPIIITDEMVDAGLFTLDYPDGWRVVKLSIAGAPIHFVFSSPDETMRIDLEQTECIFPEITPEFGDYWPRACRSLNGLELRIEGFAEHNDRVIFDSIFSTMFDSIQFR